MGFDRIDVFRRYARERSAAVPTGYRHDPFPRLTRFAPVAPDLDGIVMFARLEADEADAVIEAQIGHFAALGRSWEWKVHDLDTPADLGSRLEARGFVRGDVEAFMVYAVASCASTALRSRARIEKVQDAAGIDDVIAVQHAVWREDLPWLRASLLAALDQQPVYCAYVGDRPVGTGWMEFPPGSTSATLHGGAILPEFRGQRIYTDLFLARVAEAKRRGVEFLTVDALPMSRPILIGRGFHPICETTPFHRAL